MKFSAFSNNIKVSKLLKWFIVGVIMISMSILIVVSNPLKVIIEMQLSLRSGTLFHSLWLKPPIDVYLTVYVFNVTNHEAFVSGIDKKLKLEEVGPYVYQEMLEHQNVSFHQNNTVTYTPKRSWRFIRDRSIGDIKVDRVIVPNIPIMGITSAATTMSSIAAIAVNALAKRMRSKIMVNVTVDEYLWGYKDPIISAGRKLLPNFINFEEFGILDRIMDEGANKITISTETVSEQVNNKADSNNASRGFAIDNFNGNKGMNYWGYDNDKTPCATLNGTFDGTLFPRDLKQGEIFRVYRKGFCRSLPLQFVNKTVLNGIEAYVLNMPSNAYDNELNDAYSSCLCKDKRCLKKGLSNIRPCYYNIPLAISFPHFLHADPAISEPFEGLRPNESLHGSKVFLQPQLGIPMRATSRIQANMIIHETKYSRDISYYSGMIIPLIWMEIKIEDLSFGLQFLVKILFTYAPYMQWIISGGLLLMGIYNISIAFVLNWLSMKMRADDAANERKKSIELTPYADSEFTSKLLGTNLDIEKLSTELVQLVNPFSYCDERGV